MAVAIRVVTRTLVMDLSMMLPVRLDLRTMVMMPLMQPGSPPDLLKLGMQHHGQLQRLQLSHFHVSRSRMSHFQANPG